jgi:hypothetical protein
MNNLVLFLGVLLIVLIYILYVYFTMNSTTLFSSAHLMNTSDTVEITSKPTSTRYAYGIWVYVNSWDPTISKVIFHRTNNVKLYMDKLSPTLKCDITMGASDVETVTITDNFPLQKWTHVIVNADNQYFDFYLDGKLVKSIRAYEKNTASSNDEMVGSSPKQPTKDAKMILGNGDAFDAHVTRFYHWNQPIDPHTAWKTYMAGNGQSTLANATGAYNVNLHVLKDNIEYTKFQLF